MPGGEFVDGTNLIQPFSTPPGEDRLVFRFPGRIPADAPADSTVTLQLSNGPDGQGWGPNHLVNELTHTGEARYFALQPQRLRGGLLKIIPPEIVIFIRGDADRNGAVALDDALFLLTHLFLGGVQLTCPDAADANDDGELGIIDPLTVLRGLFVDRSVISAPYPLSGRDRSADGLGICR
jgi:hypothetical protein